MRSSSKGSKGCTKSSKNSRHKRKLHRSRIPWQESRTSHWLNVHEEVPQLGEGLLAPWLPCAHTPQDGQQSFAKHFLDDVGGRLSSSRAPNDPSTGSKQCKNVQIWLTPAGSNSESRHHSLLWQCRPATSPQGVTSRRPFKHKQLRQLLMSTNKAPRELEHGSKQAF